MKTVFESIIEREIPADIIYEDELIIAFKDIQPKAPSHFLVVPKRRILNLQSAQAEDLPLLTHILEMIRTIAEEQGLAEKGYRVVTNIGPDGGQTIEHLHFHVLGGRTLKWPPG